MKTLVKGGRILDPKNQIDEVADLFIADQRICGIGSAPSGFTADRILDAGDKIVCPGFVEIGCDLEGLSPDTWNVKQELLGPLPLAVSLSLACCQFPTPMLNS